MKNKVCSTNDFILNYLSKELDNCLEKKGDYNYIKIVDKIVGGNSSRKLVKEKNKN